MGLIRFLLIAICVLYIIRSLVRLLLPFLFGGLVNKAQQQYQQQNNTRSKRPDGAVKVDYIPQGKKNTVPDSEGEFVDYEEVK